MNRTSTALAAVSSVACLTLIIATVVGYRLDQESRSLLDEKRHGIAMTPHFHIRFSEFGVWFYSEDLPYHGSVRALVDEKGNLYYGDGRRARPIRDRLWHLGNCGVRLEEMANLDDQTVRREISCNLPGVYYRRFEWIGERPDWTLMVSCWYPFLLFSGLPVWWIFRWWRSRPKLTLQSSSAHSSASSG